MNIMTLKEFVEDGYLQEVNRQFFHPRGLALSISLNEKDNIYEWAEIWDCRDDPEGIIYGEEHIKENSALFQKKAEIVEQQLNKHLEARKKILDNKIIQSIPDEITSK